MTHKLSIAQRNELRRLVAEYVSDNPTCHKRVAKVAGRISTERRYGDLTSLADFGGEAYKIAKAMIELLIIVGGIDAGISAVHRLWKRVRLGFRARAPVYEGMSCREAIAYLLAVAGGDGLTVKEIVEETGFSDSAVRSELTNLLRKQGIKRRRSGRKHIYYLDV